MLPLFLNKVERGNENCLSPAQRRDEFFNFSEASLETINVRKPANEGLPASGVVYPPMAGSSYLVD